MNNAAVTLQPKEYGFSVPEVVRLMPQGLATALDVGCSNGGLGYFLKSRMNFREVIGIEYAEASAQKAAQYLDAVYVGDACAIELPEKYVNHFDVIIYADVLEHLYDPWAVVSKFKQYLHKDGFVLASIPNLKNLFIILNLLSGRFDYTDLGLLDSTHIRFFTSTTALEMFTNAGFEMITFFRSLREGKWHADLNSGNTIDPGIIQLYDELYQKHVAGKDVSADLKQYFGLFSFSDYAVADLFTAQYHMLFRIRRNG